MYVKIRVKYKGPYNDNKTILSMKMSYLQKYKEQIEHSVSCTVSCDCLTQTTLYYFFQSKLSMEDWNKNDERKLREGIEKFRGRGREYFNIDLRTEYRVYAEEKEQREERRLQE